MTDLQQSYLRSILKIVGTVLATKGVIDVNAVDVVVPALEAFVGSALTIYGVWASHKNHA